MKKKKKTAVLESVSQSSIQTTNPEFYEESYDPESTENLDTEDIETIENIEGLDDLNGNEAVSSASSEVTTETEETAFIGNENGSETITEGVEMDLENLEGFDESILEMDREGMTDPEDDSTLLDAYYAEFGDPVVAALLKKRPELQETIQEVVIGTDDRIRVTATKRYPWRCICSLRITARDGSRWIGTGWLAGPRLVVTAGHVVYMHSRGGWVKSIEVIPGRNGATKPFGSCNSSFFYSVKGWTNNHKRSHDYGAIVLPKACKYGNQLGYFGFGYYSYFTLLGLKVNLSGYPGDKPAGTQWWHARKVKFVTSRTLVYNIDTAGGQSGSPVWWLRKGKRYAVGIHTNGSSGGNSATRITKPVFNNIKKWRNAHT